MTQITLAKCKVDQLVKLCEEFGNQPGELINILHKAQGLIGYLPREVQDDRPSTRYTRIQRVRGSNLLFFLFNDPERGTPDLRVHGNRLLRSGCRESSGRIQTYPKGKCRRDHPGREVLFNQLTMRGSLRTCPGCTDR